MAKPLPDSGKIASLPKEEKRLLLPQPPFHFWSFVALIFLPVIFVALYALNPWFTISGQAADVIIKILVVIFLIALAFLIITFVKLVYDVVKSRPEALRGDKNSITITLLLLLSLMLLSTVVQLLQPPR